MSSEPQEGPEEPIPQETPDGGSLEPDGPVSQVTPDVLGGERRTAGDKAKMIAGAWPVLLLYFAVLLAYVTVNSMVYLRSAPEGGAIGGSIRARPYVGANFVFAMILAVTSPLIILSLKSLSGRRRRKDDAPAGEGGAKTDEPRD